jgi:predicted extracellular nuclease
MRKRTFTKIIPFLFALFLFNNLFAQLSEPGDTVFVANWNVENLFDTMDDPKTNDSEFLPTSEKEWTEERLETKLDHLTHVINYMNHGCGPDLIALEEVENINVVKRLIYKLDRSRDYVVAHRDSPDERGIEACIVFDRNVFDIDRIVPIHVDIPTGYKTRDILHVIVIHKKSKTKFHFFANHWPSRIGGDEKTEPNRIAAAKVLRTVVDSLMKFDKDKQIVILGDFNDEPDNKSIDSVLNAKDFKCGQKKIKKSTLLNLSYKKAGRGEGSYLYDGNWNMLDQIIISPNLMDGKKVDYKCGSFEIIKPEFMLIKSGKKAGGPSSTYSGKKYFGGYSDHFPVGAKFFYKKGK